MLVIRAIDLHARHIGRTLDADVSVPGADGTGDVEHIHGVIRWITFTSDTVLVAVEATEGEAPVEWQFFPIETVELTATKPTPPKHQCQWNMPTDEEPDSEQCTDTATDGELLCQAHADLNADLMDAYRDSFAGYQN